MRTVRTWWGKKFIEALEDFIDAGRLARGKGYANEHRIRQWKITGNRVSARILGNANPYYGIDKEPLYTTTLELQPISTKDWQTIIQRLGKQAAFVSRLLLNEVPDTIEEPFAALGLRLLPRNAGELNTQCSCPDWANPCKHVAGLDYFLAAQLDQDPFLLFELRGLPRETLLRQLRETPLGRILAQALSMGEEPLRADPAYFTQPIAETLPPQITLEAYWRPRKRLPETIEPATPPAVSGLPIKKGGDFPPFWNREQSFIETLELFYEACRKRSRDW